jgi:hypothetical protein
MAFRLTLTKKKLIAEFGRSVHPGKFMAQKTVARCFLLYPKTGPVHDRFPDKDR